MRRVSFQSILHGAAREARLDPMRDLREPATSDFREFINKRVAHGWRWDFWPEWTPTEERTRAGDATTGYYFPLTEAGKTTIETVKAQSVFKRNPLTNPRNPWRLPFSLTTRGILVPHAPETVWVTFRPAPPEFSVSPWVNSTAYVPGDRRWYFNAATEGETYVALQASTGKNPITEPAYWQRVDFPEALASYVKQAAAADYLRRQGQDERADDLLKLAETQLEDDVDRELESQGQYERAGVRSYGQ